MYQHDHHHHYHQCTSSSDDCLSGSPYCATGIATVTQTGQAGGTYSSTAVCRSTPQAVTLTWSLPLLVPIPSHIHSAMAHVPTRPPRPLPSMHFQWRRLLIGFTILCNRHRHRNADWSGRRNIFFHCRISRSMPQPVTLTWSLPLLVPIPSHIHSAMEHVPTRPPPPLPSMHCQ